MWLENSASDFCRFSKMDGRGRGWFNAGVYLEDLDKIKGKHYNKIKKKQ